MKFTVQTTKKGNIAIILENSETGRKVATVINQMLLSASASGVLNVPSLNAPNNSEQDLKTIAEQRVSKARRLPKRRVDPETQREQAIGEVKRYMTLIGKRYTNSYDRRVVFTGIYKDLEAATGVSVNELPMEKEPKIDAVIRCGLGDDFVGIVKGYIGRHIS